MSMAAWPSIVHGGVAFHGPGQALAGLLAGGLDQAVTDEQPERDSHEHDHDRAADEFRQGELPGDQQRQDDAQLDHQVGAGDLEGHRGGEAGALAEQGTGQRHRRIGARR
jgi:hypothetical protein